MDLKSILSRAEKRGRNHASTMIYILYPDQTFCEFWNHIKSRNRVSDQRYLLFFKNLKVWSGKSANLPVDIAELSERGQIDFITQLPHLPLRLFFCSAKTENKSEALDEGFW